MLPPPQFPDRQTLSASDIAELVKEGPAAVLKALEDSYRSPKLQLSGFGCAACTKLADLLGGDTLVTQLLPPEARHR